MFRAPGIVVRRPRLERLLAMKLSASRDDVGLSDARRLLSEILKLTGRSKAEIFRGSVPFLPRNSQLTASYALEGRWEDLHGGGG